MTPSGMRRWRTPSTPGQGWSGPTPWTSGATSAAPGRGTGAPWNPPPGGVPDPGAAAGLRPTAQSAGEAVEGGADRGRPEAAGDRERGHPGRPGVGPENGDGRLTTNTVAGSACLATLRPRPHTPPRCSHTAGGQSRPDTNPRSH